MKGKQILLKIFGGLKGREGYATIKFRFNFFHFLSPFVKIVIQCFMLYCNNRLAPLGLVHVWEVVDPPPM